MALMNCPECSKEISHTALKCPSCGCQVRKPKRTLFGKIVKWIFILFNVLMLVCLIVGMNNAGHVASTATSDAEQAGVAIGASIGFMMNGIIWVIGDIIIGMLVLFTRPKS